MSKPGQQRCVAGTDEVVIYHGYPVIAVSECEGWFFGAISQFLENAPDISGDGFVVAPDGRSEAANAPRYYQPTLRVGASTRYGFRSRSIRSTISFSVLDFYYPICKNYFS